MNVEDIESKIQLPPELQDAYTRVVAAGMKVMFSKETFDTMLKQLEGPGDMSDKLGQGIARVMVFMFNESNNTIPQEVIIPAAMVLLIKAANFIKESGMAEVTDADIGRAMEVMIDSLFEGFGVDRSELDAAMEQEVVA